MSAIARQPQRAVPLFRAYLLGSFTLHWRVACAMAEPAVYTEVSPAQWGKRRQAMRLLMVLLARPGRRAGKDFLSELFWPDTEPEQAVVYLTQTVAKLRKVLRLVEGGESLLIGERAGYRLEAQEQLWMDADAAEALLQQASGQGTEALPLVQEAITLLQRGTFLEEAEGTWVLARRGRLDDLRKKSQVRLAQLLAQQGRLDEAETQLSTLLEEDPTDEDVLCHMMGFLHRQGMTHQALRRYHAFIEIAAREELEPTEAIKNLAAQLAASDRRMPTSDLLTSFSVTGEQNRTFSGESIIEAPEPEIYTRVPPLETSQETDLESSTIVDRREASKHLGILGLTLFTAPQKWFDHFSSFASSKYPNLNSETLRSFRMLTETCLRLSEGSQLITAERVLWSYLPDVEAFAQQPSEQQRFAANLVSQNYLLAASLVGHRNDLQARQHFSEQAWLYGTLAKDRNLLVAALRQLAVTFDYLERPQKVLQTYQRALLYLDDVSPRLRACIYAALSGVYAQLQQKQEAAHFIGLAYEHFPTTTEDEPNFLRLINANYHTIILWDGLNQLELNQPQRAEHIFTQLDVLVPTIRIPERIRIELLNYRAKAFSAVQNMEQACTYLEVAVNASLELHSERRLRESFTIFQQLRERWPHEQRVQQLGDCFFHALINHTQ